MLVCDVLTMQHPTERSAEMRIDGLGDRDEFRYVDLSPIALDHLGYGVRGRLRGANSRCVSSASRQKKEIDNRANQ
jgi:hypothetical protein